MDNQRKNLSGASLRHAFEEIIWPRRKLIFVGLLLIVLNRVSGLVLPASTKYLVDNAIAAGNIDALWLILGAVSLAVIVQAITSYALTMLLSVEAQHLIANLRSQVQNHVLRLPVRIFDNTKSGELVSRIMDDVEGVRNLVGTGLVQLVGGAITAIVAFVFLVLIDPVMTLLALCPLGAFAFVSFRALKTLRPAFRERAQIRAEVTGRLTETLGGIRVIKGFHAIEKEGEIFHAGVLRIFENVKRTLTTQSMLTSMGTFILGLASVLVMGYGGFLIVQGSLTIGELFSFTLFLGFLLAPIIQFKHRHPDD
jgi:subfamily B ATP-binding cassette protein MsbA